MFFSKKLNKFNTINHCFFSRNNGFSQGIYSSLNCGRGSKDKVENINKNLNVISKKMNVDKKNLILMNQTHSSKAILVDENNVSDIQFTADALVTRVKGVALGVLTADCVPIILYDEINKVIGCIHAGWKGSQKGVIRNTLEKFKELNNNNKITAAIGPCIGLKSYEVGIEFYENFLSENARNKQFFLKKSDNKFLFDIRNYSRNLLIDNGVTDIDNINLDTFTNIDNFFSYRRSLKLTETDYGRCVSTICLKI